MDVLSDFMFTASKIHNLEYSFIKLQTYVRALHIEFDQTVPKTVCDHINGHHTSFGYAVQNYFDQIRLIK